MRLSAARWVVVGCAALACSCARGHDDRDRAVRDAMKRLESRVAALEGGGAQATPGKTSVSAPVGLRAQSLRAAADWLEKADAARRRGDAARAAQLYQNAVDEVGADTLIDVEPLFRDPARHADKSEPPVHEEAPPVAQASPEGAPAVATPASLTTQAPAPSPASPEPRRTHARASDRASLGGAIRLEGAYAAEGGMGVVMLQPIGRTVTRAPRHAVVEQRRKDFLPHVLEVPVGSTVAFPNSDPVYHNVFSLSDPKKFDLGLYKNGESRDVTFSRAGVVRLLCNLHASMNAFVVVHEEPYATVTDRAGRFQLRDLMPGRYRVRVWNERARELVSREIELEPGQNRLYLPMKADVAPIWGPDKEGNPRGPQSPHS